MPVFHLNDFANFQGFTTGDDTIPSSAVSNPSILSIEGNDGLIVIHDAADRWSEADITFEIP